MKAKLVNCVKKLLRTHFLFFILIPLIFASQIYLLQPQLKYGFGDIDDGSVAFFITLKRQYPNPVQFIMKSLQEWPTLYLHQYYYIGILNFFLGDNFVAYHQTAHFFKALAALSTYPLFFVLSGSILVAFVSSIFFAISYATTGDLLNVVTAGNYLAISTMSIFLTIYFHLIKSKESRIFPLYPLALIFLFLTFVISTARTYPLVIIILLSELFVLFRNRSCNKLNLNIRRFVFFLLPLLLAIILTLITSANITERISTVLALTIQYNLSGNDNGYLLIPFTAFASTILPTYIWPSYIYLLFFFLTPALALLLSKHPSRFIMITFIIWVIGILLASILTGGANYSIDLENKSPIGFYILGLSLAFFLDWLEHRNSLYVGFFLGPIFSFIMIFGMWVGTHERNLLFFNEHRYLTLSTVFINFFLGTFTVVLYKKLRNTFFKRIAYFSFLLILVYFVISVQEIKQLFDSPYLFVGNFEDQNYMRGQLLPYYQNLSIENPRLIYIDKDTDLNNKNYYEKNIIAGYRGDGNAGWAGWWPQINFRRELVPPIITDFNKLKSLMVTRDGIKGFIFEDIFYNSNNFFALRLIDKKVLDITDQVKKDLKSIN